MTGSVKGRSSGIAGPDRDRFELAVLAALTCLAFAVLSGLLLRTVIKGGAVTGADGFLVVDPLQYLNWIRQSSGHFTAANLYDFAPPEHDFLHPGILLGGLVYRVTGGLVLSYAVFKPVAVGCLFAGVAGICHRHLTSRSDRRLALVVGLFYCSPAAFLGGLLLAGDSPVKVDLDFAGGEVWTGSYLWGYAFTAIAVGVVPLALLGWERSRLVGRARFLATAAAVLLTSWLQPWQGATVLAVLVASEAIVQSRARRFDGLAARRLGLLVLAGLAPLIYYFVLSRVDPSWRLAGEANALGRWPVWVLAVTLGPLLIPALFAFRGFDRGDPGAVAVRIWPIAALAVYFAPVGTFPFHALQGVQFPLAVLAVVAWRKRLGQRSMPVILAIGMAIVLVVPGTLYRVDQIRSAVSLGVQPFFLTDDERSALAVIASDPRPGGVITDNYLATVIPAHTGRQTFFGAGSWTPDFKTRRALAGALFAGRLSDRQAGLLLERPGAGFVLDPCRSSAMFSKQILRFARLMWRHGCVRLYRLNRVPAGHASRPLPYVKGLEVG